MGGRETEREVGPQLQRGCSELKQLSHNSVLEKSVPLAPPTLCLVSSPCNGRPAQQLYSLFGWKHQWRRLSALHSSQKAPGFITSMREEALASLQVRLIPSLSNYCLMKNTYFLPLSLRSEISEGRCCLPVPWPLTMRAIYFSADSCCAANLPLGLLIMSV